MCDSVLNKIRASFDPSSGYTESEKKNLAAADRARCAQMSLNICSLNRTARSTSPDETVRGFNMGTREAAAATAATKLTVTATSEKSRTERG